jgi:hypothetical protein
MISIPVDRINGTGLESVALVEKYSEFKHLSRQQCQVVSSITLLSDNIELIVNSDQDSEHCLPRQTSLVVSGGIMTNLERLKAISQIYKFETISSIIFALTLVSCHFELRRVKLSLIECQQGNMRTYASKLSILSATLVQMWVIGLATFYLSLALVYDGFTWYFLWPTLLLSIMAGIYLQQIINTMLKLKSLSGEHAFAEHQLKLYFLLSLLVVPLVYFFDDVLLSNFWTTALSACIWLPQIIKNARYGQRNIPKMRHVLLLQASVSWLTVYIKFNATSIFNLKPQDSFGAFYTSLIGMQLWTMLIQKWWSPRIIVPDRLKKLLLEAAQFNYKKNFYQY